MKIAFPDAWNELRFPHKRAELIENLREIVETENKPKALLENFDIDELVHFLFDDTDLADVSRDTIGEILMSRVEQDAIRELTATLDSMVKELGDKPTHDFMAHPAWPNVIFCASLALARLTERGLPRFATDN